MSSRRRVPHKNRKNACFGCGAANPNGLQLKFQPVSGERRATVEARTRIPRRFDGAPHILHGGVVATLLDEAMSKVNAELDLVAVTTRLEVRYRRPVPSSQLITIRAYHRTRRKQSLYHAAEIRCAEGRLLAEATGRFHILSRDVVTRMSDALAVRNEQPGESV